MTPPNIALYSATSAIKPHIGTVTDADRRMTLREPALELVIRHTHSKKERIFDMNILVKAKVISDNEGSAKVIDGEERIPIETDFVPLEPGTYEVEFLMKWKNQSWFFQSVYYKRVGD